MSLIFALANSLSFAASPLVTVLVGDQKKQYTIHKDRLVKTSPFFKTRLDNPMIESTNGQITFPEDQCRAFDVVVNWIYGGDVEGICGPGGLFSAMKAYQLADKYMMPQLQDSLIQEIKKYLKGYCFLPQYVSWAVKHLKDTSALRIFLIDQIIWELVNYPEFYQNQPGKEMVPGPAKSLGILLITDPEVAAQLLWGTQKLKPDHKTNPAGLEGCHYHVHPDGDKCDSSY